MKTIYLHIGPHKTGTTTIQQSLNMNRDLLFRHRIFIPKAGQVFPSQAGQHNLAWELITDDRFNNVYGTWKDLLNEINEVKADQIILSSEDFSFSTPENIRQIKDYLHDYIVYIIVYVRRQDLKLQSQWAVKIKTGKLEDQYESFHTWLEMNNYEFLNCNYHELSQKWSTVFGKDNVIVRVLEKKQLNGTLFQDFLSTCKVGEPEQYESSKDMNITPGIKVLVLFQEFKKRLIGKLNVDSRTRFYSTIAEYGELAGWNKQKWSLIDQEIYKKISDRYRSSNQQVARDYFGRDELFLEPFKEEEFTEFNVDDFRPDELLDMFAFVFINTIEPIYTSKGWRLLQKFRSIRNNVKSFIKKD